MQRICVIEDSIDMQALITHELQDWFHISCANSISEANELILNEKFNLILLDIRLPDGNGFEYCVQLKNNQRLKNIPIIFLTAKSEPTDQFMGFSIGADDYVVKPFNPLELRARIQARIQKTKSEPVQPEYPIYGHLKFDLLRLRVCSIQNNREIDLKLTPFEFRILYFLAIKQGQYIERKALLKQVLEPNVHVDESNIYTHISSIRKKLAEHQNYLECLPKVGYRFLVPNCK